MPKHMCLQFVIDEVRGTQQLNDAVHKACVPVVGYTGWTT